MGAAANDRLSRFKPKGNLLVTTYLNESGMGSMRRLPPFTMTSHHGNNLFVCHTSAVVPCSILLLPFASGWEKRDYVVAHIHIRVGPQLESSVEQTTNNLLHDGAVETFSVIHSHIRFTITYALERVQVFAVGTHKSPSHR